MSNITRLQIYWQCAFYIVWSVQLEYYLTQKKLIENEGAQFCSRYYKRTWRSSVALNQKLWNICFWYERTVPKSSPYICIDSHHPKIMCKIIYLVRPPLRKPYWVYFIMRQSSQCDAVWCCHHFAKWKCLVTLDTLFHSKGLCNKILLGRGWCCKHTNCMYT